jgi:hypothetical protein
MADRGKMQLVRQRLFNGRERQFIDRARDFAQTDLVGAPGYNLTLIVAKFAGLFDCILPYLTDADIEAALDEYMNGKITEEI